MLPIMRSISLVDCWVRWARAALRPPPRQTAPGFTGTRRLDRRVQGQQVGLVGQTTNHVQHLADVTGFIGQIADQGRGALHIGAHAFDGADGFLHQITAVARRRGGVLRGFGGAYRIARDFFHGAGHFVDCGGGLFDFVVLLGQATGAFVGDAVQLFGGGGQLGGRAGDALQGVAQLVLHLRHGRQQAPGFVGAVDVDRAGQVAFGDGFGGVQRFGDRFGDADGQQPGEQEGQAVAATSRATTRLNAEEYWSAAS
jgi:hypothetical protein